MPWQIKQLCFRTRINKPNLKVQQNIEKIEVKAIGAPREIINIQPSVKNGTDSGPILRTEGVVARRSSDMSICQRYVMRTSATG